MLAKRTKKNTVKYNLEKSHDVLFIEEHKSESNRKTQHNGNGNKCLSNLQSMRIAA